MTIVTLMSIATIVMLPIWWMANGYKCWTTIWWLYDQDSKTVYICWGMPDQEFILHHELGHYFWFNYLNDLDRSEYRKEYDKAKKIWIKGFYRDYSMTSVLEDFADNFALSFQSNQSSFLIRKRIKLIKKYFIKYN